MGLLFHRIYIPAPVVYSIPSRWSTTRYHKCQAFFCAFFSKDASYIYFKAERAVT
jgi:hypothetical protein